MSSTTSRAALYKPASGENVNVVTDLNNNWDTIDLNMNFRTCTSSTRPSTRWDGLTIHETDTRKSYVWNATPAVSGWYEIYTAETALTQINLSGASSGVYTETHKITGDTNSRLQVRADGRLEWGPGNAATDSFLRRTGTNALTTDGALTVAGAATVQSTTDSTAVNVSGGGTFAKSLTVGGTAGLAGGVGVLQLANATTAPTAAPSASIILSSESGRPKVYTPSGLVQYTGGAMALSPTSPVTVANTASETTIGSVTIPANDAVVGAVYRMRAWGQASTTGTPTLRFRSFLGANALGATSSFTTATVTNKAWSVDCTLVCLGTGGTGSWFGNFTVVESVSVTGAAPTTATSRNDGGATVTNATTSSNVFDLRATWGTASSSNTLTCRGFIVERVA